MESVKRLIDERALHKREYDIRVTERLMQSKKGKVDSSKALNVGLIVTKCNETESKSHVSSSRSEKDTHAEDADINSVNDKQPMAEVQLTAKHNILSNDQQHYKESKSIYDTYLLEEIDRNTTLDLTNMGHRGGEFDQNAVKFENADLKSQIQEKVFANASLKNELRKIKRTSVDTKLAKSSTLGKPTLQSHRNQSVVRQPTAFKSERPRFSKLRFASQVDVQYDLPKSVTPHFLPIARDHVLEKPHLLIAPGLSRNSSKESYTSNDMTHKYYLEEAKKKTHERDRKSITSVMPFSKSQNTTKSCKSKSRGNNQPSRVLSTSKSSCPMTTAMPKADHSSKSSPSLTSNTLFTSPIRSVSLMQIMMPV
uniref:Uncharacterized protein n=1 Tax=Tanacetum cinerariifolium TaxID=118510 RepID=A0A699GLC1_TANCI|nr:hypothetical protein [Tanacetum cinerariifolium]